MNSAAIITFVVIAGLVWGGAALIATTTLRKEGRKAKETQG
jgi:hypothetical protein